MTGRCMQQHHSDETLSAYLDGDTSEIDRGALEQHLAACGECRESLAQLRALKVAAAGLDQLLPSAGAWQRIQSRTVARRRPRLRWLWAGAPVAVAAALLVVILARPEPEAAKPGTRERVEAVPVSDEVAAELVAEYEEYMRGIDEALEEIGRAMAENPRNPMVRMAYLNARTSQTRAWDELTSYGGD